MTEIEYTKAETSRVDEVVSTILDTLIAKNKPGDTSLTYGSALATALTRYLCVLVDAGAMTLGQVDDSLVKIKGAILISCMPDNARLN